MRLALSEARGDTSQQGTPALLPCWSTGSRSLVLIHLCKVESSQVMQHILSSLRSESVALKLCKHIWTGPCLEVHGYWGPARGQLCPVAAWSMPLPNSIPCLSSPSPATISTHPTGCLVGGNCTSERWFGNSLAFRPLHTLQHCWNSEGLRPVWDTALQLFTLFYVFKKVTKSFKSNNKSTICYHKLHIFTKDNCIFQNQNHLVRNVALFCIFANLSNIGLNISVILNSWIRPSTSVVTRSVVICCFGSSTWQKKVWPRTDRLCVWEREHFL